MSNFYRKIISPEEYSSSNPFLGWEEAMFLNKKGRLLEAKTGQLLLSTKGKWKEHEPG